MRQRFNCLIGILAILLLVASAAVAHHSVAGQFDTSKSLTLKGSISKVNWMNPHIYVYLDVKEADGTMSTWALETLPTAMMRRAGLSNSANCSSQGWDEAHGMDFKNHLRGRPLLCAGRRYADPIEVH